MQLILTNTELETLEVLLHSATHAMSHNSPWEPVQMANAIDDMWEMYWYLNYQIR